MSTTMTIKIGTVPGIMREVEINAGTTYAEAATIAGISTQGYTFRRDGAEVSADSEIAAGREPIKVVLTKQIKGNVAVVA